MASKVNLKTPFILFNFVDSSCLFFFFAFCKSWNTVDLQCCVSFRVQQNDSVIRVCVYVRMCLCVCLCVCVFMCVCAQSFSRVWLSCTPWIGAHQAPLSMEISRQRYGSGLQFSSPRDLPDPGIKPVSLASPALAGRFFTQEVLYSFLQFFSTVGYYKILK